MAGPGRRRGRGVRGLVRIVVTVVAFVVLSLFVFDFPLVEAQSMWPALRGGIDRVLVDRITGFGRDPERFELWVFRRMEGQKPVLFVKRVLGLPGEVIDFRGGDLFIGAAEIAPARLERPAALIEAQLLKVPGVAAAPGRSPWDVSGGAMERDGEGAITLNPSPGGRCAATFIAGHGVDPHCIRDDHLAADGRVIRGRNAVPDVRITLGPVSAERARFTVVHELGHGEDRRVVITDTGLVIESRVDGIESVRGKFPGETGDRGLRIETLDGMFRVLLPDGNGWRMLYAEPRDTMVPAGASTLRIEAEGGAARVASLEVVRDVHYVWGAETPPNPQPVPAARFFFAGDNPEVSVDSRAPGFGCIPKGALVGRVRAVVWPLPMRVPR